ncbi:MAG: hypothetical protein K6F53_02845 [Lachnospiraceae bacterium]|nr:hypothetical protein [Lachnospiraceae bacterium]
MKKILIGIITIVFFISSIAYFAPVSASAKAKRVCACAGCEYEAVDHSLYCSIHTCQKPDCNSFRNNGTVYCDYHAREWLCKSGKTACAVVDCYCPASGNSSYCSTHKCKEKHCRSKKAEGSDYCITHDKEKNKEKSTTKSPVTGTTKSASKNSSTGTTKSASKSSVSGTTKKSSTGSTKSTTKNTTKNTSKSSSNSTSGKSSGIYRNHASTSSKSTTSSKKKSDTYDVYSYKSAQDFADDKYEEFYDYEDDYEDEDEAYDAAEDYWREHH